MDKLRIATVCSGIGAPEQALKNLGIDHVNVFACEIDKYARMTYQANHDTEIFYDDITKLDYANLPDHDILIGGFPCFPKGTLITTSEGLKDIVEIKKGDMVLTHKKRFKPVVTPMKKHKIGIMNLKVMGLPEFKVTEEHPFYCVERTTKYNSKLKKYEYFYSKPKWVECKDLTKNHYIAFGKSELEENPENLTEEECWLIGRYIADGFIRNNKRPDRKNSYNNQVIYGIGKHKLQEFKDNIKTYYVGYVEERTSIKCKIINKRLMELCLACGKGAINKKIPGFIINLPKDLLKCFFSGYMSGDGGLHKNTYRAVSISKQLIYQLGQLVNKLEQKHYSIIFTKTPDTTIIEGRVVNQNDYYSIQYKKDLKTKYFYHNDFIFSPVRSLTFDPDFKDYVYNFEVEDDNSYIANNLIAHNCQSWSLSGKRQGFDDEQGRGTIFFNILEILKAKKPACFILENVKGLLSHNEGQSFKAILDSLSSSINGQFLMFPYFDTLGYDVYWKVLNATDYGIPQNRERVFIVGFKKPVSFKFPEKQPLKLKLIDLLEDNPDQKYFLSEKAIQGLLNHKEKHKERGNGFGANILELDSDYSPTIPARYFKDGSDCLINTDICKTVSSSGLGLLDRHSWDLVKDTKSNSQGYRVYDTEKSVTRDSNAGGGGAKTGLYAVPVLTPEREKKRQNGRRFKNEGDDMFTLTAQDKHGVYDGCNIRRLTPLECFRLMGFPDSFIKPVSETQQYKQAGNSIVVNVMEAILKEVLKVL